MKIDPLGEQETPLVSGCREATLNGKERRADAS